MFQLQAGRRGAIKHSIHLLTYWPYGSSVQSLESATSVSWNLVLQLLLVSGIKQWIYNDLHIQTRANLVRESLIPLSPPKRSANSISSLNPNKMQIHSTRTQISRYAHLLQKCCQVVEIGRVADRMLHTHYFLTRLKRQQSMYGYVDRCSTVEQLYTTTYVCIYIQYIIQYHIISYYIILYYIT
jgi:phosphoglycerate-specific signal transduction histidine kinase